MSHWPYSKEKATNFLKQYLPDGYEFKLKHPADEGHGGEPGLFVKISHDNRYISVFIEQLTSNCGIVHFYAWDVYKPTVEMLKAIEQLCYNFKYTTLSTGINNVQEDVKTLLEESGWEISRKFRSRRTFSTCYMYTKLLPWSKEDVDAYLRLGYKGNPEDV